VTALLWSRTDPYRCCCDDTYRPQLTVKGLLVKTREPAWRMAEQTRDPGCLQERARALSKAYRTGYQHHKTSRGSGAGYPDCHFWVPAGPGVQPHAFVELKRMGQDPTAAQVTVMAGLQDTGALVYLARPCCLLVGAFDELVADLAGVACRYTEGDRTGPVFPIAPATRPADAGPRKPAAGTAPARPGKGPSFRPAQLPGSEPVPFTPAIGIVVPHPATTAAVNAMTGLEDWLRAAGFSPIDVPYPIRLVTVKQHLHVQCRIGLARPGSDERVWRGGTPVDEFPEDLLKALGALVVFGPSSVRVAEQIAGTRVLART
jgi:hypothetical protein